MKVKNINYIKDCLRCLGATAIGFSGWMFLLGVLSSAEYTSDAHRSFMLTFIVRATAGSGIILLAETI